MPCTDVSEALTLTLDAQERVVDYTLDKITCGGSVRGADLLDNWILGQPIDAIMALRPEQVAAANRESPVKEYLRLKHLLAVQAALAEYTGISVADGNQLLTITGVEYSPDGVELTAVIDTPVLTEKVGACGLCGSSGNNCGSTAAPK